jgi:uncharacterized protein (TIRG00374 family)
LWLYRQARFAALQETAALPTHIAPADILDGLIGVRIAAIVDDLPELDTEKNGSTRIRQMLSGSSWTLRLLKIGLTVVMLGAVLHSVDLSAAWKYASEQNSWLLLLAAGLVSFQFGCGASRWYLILRRLKAAMPVLESVRIYYISVFFGTCLLASIGGDVARVWLAYRIGVRVSTAAISVVIDRVAALAGVALIVIATAPLFMAVVGPEHAIPAAILAVLAGVGLLGIVVVAQLDRIPIGRWARFRIVDQLVALGEATRAVYLRPATAVPVLALAVISQTAASLATYAIARSLGLNVTATDCLVLMQPITLLATLPISIGGWGVREAAMVTFFGLVGVPSSAAVVLSIQVGLIAVVLSLPGGILFLVQQSRVAKKK